ncbi:MAG: ribonuclease HII, partial [Desulfurococcales archaeon]|nr:ribonuclease HII [Desulfurococcales archaeon]
MIVIGVDEAGRGSLIGELIVAAVAVPIDLLEDLKELGVKDSKLLTPEQREELYRTISRKLVFSVSAIKPREIDHENINVLTSNALYTNLSRIFKRIDPESVERIVIDKFG